MVNIGGHHTFFGLKALIDKIYSSTNERFTTQEIWYSRLEKWLKAVSFRENEENIISHQFIHLIKKLEVDK